MDLVIQIQLHSKEDEAGVHYFVGLHDPNGLEALIPQLTSLQAENLTFLL